MTLDEFAVASVATTLIVSLATKWATAPPADLTTEERSSFACCVLAVGSIVAFASALAAVAMMRAMS